MFERNRADDTFGFGVVFSDATLAGIHAADPVLREALTEHGVHWDAIEVRLKGERFRCGGNGMAADRPARPCSTLLQERAATVGRRAAFLHRGRRSTTCAGLRPGRRRRRRRTRGSANGSPTHLGADGRDGHGEVHLVRHRLPVRRADLRPRARPARGVRRARLPDRRRTSSTFIVETDEESWRAAGLDEFDVTQPPGPSDLTAKAYLEKLFAEQIDGHPLLVNNSRWGNFRTRRTRRWHTFEPTPVALLGDAVHTAHFSVGSGTKMAMEDAVALAAALAEHPATSTPRWPRTRRSARPSVEKIQDSARPSLSWWEHFGRYHDAFEPWQFAYHFLTRSITDAQAAPGATRTSSRPATARTMAAPRTAAEPLGAAGSRSPAAGSAAASLQRATLAADRSAGRAAAAQLEPPDGRAGALWLRRTREERTCLRRWPALHCRASAGPGAGRRARRHRG